jgi:hypothetical protein
MIDQLKIVAAFVEDKNIRVTWSCKKAAPIHQADIYRLIPLHTASGIVDLNGRS